MPAAVRCLFPLLLLAAVAVTPLMAQAPRVTPARPQQGQSNNNNNNRNQNKNAKEPEEVRIEDPRLIDLHKQFIENVEKLAGEYEKKNELEKARNCYSQIIRLVPQYTPAKDKLEGVKAREAVAETKRVDIFANRPWQDTGVIVGEGKPVSIKAIGTWKVKIDYDLDADGIEIPPELKDFKIGSLVGMIVTNPDSTDTKDNPIFAVGTSHSFTARQTGRLWLRMYDADPKDNVGKLSVEISGSFEKKAPGT